MVSRLGPLLTVILLGGPILFGLAGTILPAFGYLPALGGETLSLSPFAALTAQPGICTSAALSLWTGLASSAVALAVTASFVAAWSGTRIFTRVQGLISPLLALPHAAAALGLAFLIAPSGLIARILSPGVTGWERPPDLLLVNDPLGLSLIAGLAVKEIPFLLLIALAALPQADAARTGVLTASLGYGRIAGFLLTVWPSLYRQMRLAMFAVIAFSTSVVDMGVILGPTTPSTLAVRLVGWMGDPDLGMRFLASAGAMLQLGVTLLALLLWIGVERAGALLRRGAERNGRRFRRDRWLRAGALAGMTSVALVVLAGLATLAVWSFAGLWPFPDALPHSLSAKGWREAAPRAGSLLLTTTLVAILASLIALALAILCLVREGETGRPAGRRALAFIYLPLIVPQTAFLFGLQLLFVGAGATSSLPALVLAHLIFVLPYVFLSLSDPWRAFDRRYEMVAAGLGKSAHATLFLVRAPMLSRAILTAAAVGFAVSVGQYLPTLLIGAGRLPTITTEAVALASGGSRRVIGVYAVLQTLLPMAGFAIATLLPWLLLRRWRALRI